jgi:hypothetical protein
MDPIECILANTGQLEDELRPYNPEVITCLTKDEVDCDPYLLHKWLCELADLVNSNAYQLKISIDHLIDTINRVSCLEDIAKNHENRIDTIELTLIDHTNRIEWLEGELGNVNQQFTMINNRIDWIYNHLPENWSMWPDDWKFAAGNINHTSFGRDSELGIFTHALGAENHIRGDRNSE